VGYASSQGYQGYTNLGWSLLVIQSTAQAFHSIWILWWLFGAVFLLTSLIATGVAHMIAKRIASPVQSLTAWARHFQTLATTIQPEISGALEVRELSQAFSQLSEDLERSRQQVIHAAKLAVVGEMAAIMAHEVRTPLGILQTSAQILQLENQLTDDGRDMARIIVEESMRLNRLISALLDCARPRPPHMRQQALQPIIQRVIELLAKQAENKSISLETELPSQAVAIEADEELLVQVFLNLVLNAIQILPVGGRIRVSLDDSHADYLLIRIEDNGPGVAPELQQRLFDPFFTTRENGIGLGLTVTQQIITMHAGNINLWRSDLGGACFIVSLPRHQGQLPC
jgi:signal transduction histidine kinase